MARPGITDADRHGAQWTEVDSTCLSEFIYYTDRVTEERVLSVRFRDSGKVYNYRGVPPAVYAHLIGAESRGAFLNREIKGKYPFTRG